MDKHTRLDKRSSGNSAMPELSRVERHLFPRPPRGFGVTDLLRVVLESVLESTSTFYEYFKDFSDSTI